MSMCSYGIRSLCLHACLISQLVGLFIVFLSSARLGNNSRGSDSNPRLNFHRCRTGGGVAFLQFMSTQSYWGDGTQCHGRYANSKTKRTRICRSITSQDPSILYCWQWCRTSAPFRLVLKGRTISTENQLGTGGHVFFALLHILFLSSHLECSSFLLLYSCSVIKWSRLCSSKFISAMGLWRGSFI